MILTIESTLTLVEIDGVECRVWHGWTADGLPCTVFVHKIAVEPCHGARFERDLECCPDPPDRLIFTDARPRAPDAAEIRDAFGGGSFRGGCTCCVWCNAESCGPRDGLWRCAERCTCDVPGGPR